MSAIDRTPSAAGRAIRLVALAAGIAACWPSSVAAQADAPSDVPVTRNLPLWEVGVAAGALSTPAYPGADVRSSRLLALPFLLYRGEILRSDQSGIGARLLHSDAAEIDIGAAASLPARSSDVPARAGMRDLGTLVEFGPRLKLKIRDFSPTQRLRFELPLRAVIEARGGLHPQGWTLEPRLVYATDAEQRRWNVEAQLGAVIGNARINRYFYEVPPQDATAARPAYAAGSGLMLMRAGLYASHRLNHDLRFFGFVRYESYAAAANRDSPLMKQDSGVSAGIGFTWTFARSAAMARE